MNFQRNEVINAVKKTHKDVNEDWNNKKYTKSFVAFIDVMGTKNLFLKAPDDFDVHKEFYVAWDEILRRQELSEYKNYLNELYGELDVKCTFISDSVVLSIDVDKANSFRNIFMILGLFIISLLELEVPYFVRGAIKIGNIYQVNNIVFGPALINVYRMESNEAKNFRIIIDNEDFSQIQRNSDEDLRNILDGFFYKEGHYYIFDYLYRYLWMAEGMISNNHNQNQYIKVLNNIHKKINYEIVNTTDEKVKAKYLWMMNYFHSSIRVCSH